MQQDGCSDIHNDPVVATSVTANGDCFFLDATDTGTIVKTAEGCKDMILESVKDAEDKYGHTVQSVVTDKATNMQNMCSLIVDKKTKTLTYGCLAHYLNRSEQDITPSGLMTLI